MPTQSILSTLNYELDEYLKRDARIFDGNQAARRIQLIIAGLAKHLGFVGEVQIFGSFSNGFKTAESDLDIMFATSMNISRDAIMSILSKFAQYARDYGFVNLTKIFNHAVVPILKITDKKSQMEVDFCINNTLGVRNSLLLRAYCEYDIRVLQLGKIVKHWAKMNDLVGTTDGYLSSYAYMLLTIFYLQSVTPPVIPNLQALASKSVPISDTKWGVEEVWETKFEDDVKLLPPSENCRCVGELLIDFFRFFVEVFDWRSRAVSVRLNQPGYPIDKFSLVTQPTECRWYIEDPFDLKHNLAARCTRASQSQISDAMRKCWSTLASTGSWVQAVPATPTSFFLKLRIPHTAMPYDLLEEFEVFGFTKLYWPSLSDGKTGNAFLEFTCATHRRRAQVKNECYVRDCQLQLHCSTHAALALAMSQNERMYSTYELSSYKMRKQAIHSRFLTLMDRVEPVMPRTSSNGSGGGPEVCTDLVQSSASAQFELVGSDSDAQKKCAFQAMSIGGANTDNRQAIWGTKFGTRPSLRTKHRHVQKAQKAHAKGACTQEATTTVGDYKSPAEPAGSGNDAPKDALTQRALQPASSLAANMDNQDTICDSGGSKALIALADCLAKSGQAKQKTRAIEALCNLATNLGGPEVLAEPVCESQSSRAPHASPSLSENIDHHKAIRDAGGSEALIALAESGNWAQIANAAETLCNLATNPDNRVAIRTVGASEALVELVALMSSRSQSGNHAPRKHASQTLISLATSPENHEIVLDEEVIALAKSGNWARRKHATEALCSLAKNPDKHNDIRTLGGFEALISMTKACNKTQRNLASEGLCSLAENPDNHPAIRAAGGFEALVELVAQVSPGFGMTVAQKNAYEALSNLAKNIENHKAIFDAGVFEVVITRAKSGSFAHKASAAEVLCSLAKNPDNHPAICIPGFDALVALANTGNKEQSVHAAETLCSLAQNPDNHAALRTTSAFEVLVKLVAFRGPESRVRGAQKHAFQALSSLAANIDNHKAILDVGGCEAIIAWAKFGNRAQKIRATAAICSLAKNLDNHSAICTLGGFETLIALAISGNKGQRVPATEALCSLANNPDNDVAERFVGGSEALNEFVGHASATVGIGSVAQKKHAFQALWSLAKNKRKTVVDVGSSDAVIARAKSGNWAQKVHAAETLCSLAVDPDNHAAIRSAGGFEALIARAKSGSRAQKTHALETLCSLAKNPDNEEAIATAGCLELIISLARKSAEDKYSNAVCSLVNSPDNRVADAGLNLLIALARSGTRTQMSSATAALCSLSKNLA